ncbi:MAG: dipeptidase [Bacteroides sp.]
MKRKLLVFFLMLLVSSPIWACTNFLITKGASRDGSCMISYAADSHYLYGELYHWPAAKYSKGTMLKVYEWDSNKYLGEIEQALETYNVVGNMNEHQLAIGETTYGGRSELLDTTGIVDYGSLIYLTLQRAKTAREAIKTMVELVERYGYASSGESFSIADANEVWVMDFIGKGVKMQGGKNLNKGAVWVARRVPDGYVCAHANQARIRTFPLADGKTSITSKELDKIYSLDVETIYAHDVISFARQMKYFVGKDSDFSFCDAYNPIEFGGARFCEVRVWAFFNAINSAMASYIDYAKGWNLNHRMPLWIKPDRKLAVEDVMDAMRDHLEGTELDMTKDFGAGSHGLPYRWRPMTWKYEGKPYVHERATATQQTGFVFVAQSRSWLPNPIGGILWFGVDDAASTVFTPMYSSMTKIPHAFEKGNGSLLKYSRTSAFWLFNKVTNFCYLRYDLMHSDLRKVQCELENSFVASVSEEDKKALELLKSDPSKAVASLTDYSNRMAATTMERWENLFEFLLMKYIDGNVKQEEEGKFLHSPYSEDIPVRVNNPDYPDWWKKCLIESTGNKLEDRSK